MTKSLEKEMPFTGLLMKQHSLKAGSIQKATKREVDALIADAELVLNRLIDFLNKVKDFPTTEAVTLQRQLDSVCRLLGHVLEKNGGLIQKGMILGKTSKDKQMSNVLKGICGN